jgi:hypothetical protein
VSHGCTEQHLQRSRPQSQAHGDPECWQRGQHGGGSAGTRYCGSQVTRRRHPIRYIAASPVENRSNGGASSNRDLQCRRHRVKLGARSGRDQRRRWVARFFDCVGSCPKGRIEPSGDVPSGKQGVIGPAACGELGADEPQRGIERFVVGRAFPAECP